MTGLPHLEATPRALPVITHDLGITNAEKAVECLDAVWVLRGDDLARPDFRAAAQTFALLAVVDALHSPGAGYNVAAAVLAAGGIQP